MSRLLSKERVRDLLLGLALLCASQIYRNTWKQ